MEDSALVIPVSIYLLAVMDKLLIFTNVVNGLQTDDRESFRTTTCEGYTLHSIILQNLKSASKCGNTCIIWLLTLGPGGFQKDFCAEPGARCKNGGTCVNQCLEAVCLCRPPYTAGRKCESCKYIYCLVSTLFYCGHVLKLTLVDMSKETIILL